MHNVFEELKELLTNLNSPIDLSNLTSKTTWQEIGLDSMDTLEFVMEVEGQYDFSIENTHNLINFGDLVEVVENKLQEQLTKQLKPV
jgi:acyl carrier protein